MNDYKVFLDTNVFDDFFVGGPAAEDIAFVLECIKRKWLLGYTSPKTLMDIYYLFHSEKGSKMATQRVKQIYSLVEITAQTSSEVKDAFALG